METKRTFTIDLTGWKGVAAAAAAGVVVGLFGVWNYNRGIKRGTAETVHMLWDSGVLNKDNFDENVSKLTKYLVQKKKDSAIRNRF